MFHSSEFPILKNGLHGLWMKFVATRRFWGWLASIQVFWNMDSMCWRMETGEKSDF